MNMFTSFTEGPVPKRCGWYKTYPSCVDVKTVRKKQGLCSGYGVDDYIVALEYLGNKMLLIGRYLLGRAPRGTFGKF